VAQKRRAAAKKAAPAVRSKAKPTDEPDGVKRNDRDQVIGLNHGGTFYPMDGIDDEDFKFVEQHLNENRLSPAAMLKEQFALIKGDEALERHIAKLAYEDMRKKPNVDRVTAADVQKFLTTREGAAMSLWLMMRKHDDSLTLEDVEGIFADCAEAEMQRKVDEANRETIKRAGLDPDAPPKDDAAPAAEPAPHDPN
jgi:hypothetical protein